MPCAQDKVNRQASDWLHSFEYELLMKFLVGSSLVVTWLEVDMAVSAHAGISALMSFVVVLLWIVFMAEASFRAWTLRKRFLFAHCGFLDVMLLPLEFLVVSEVLSAGQQSAFLQVTYALRVCRIVRALPSSYPAVAVRRHMFQRAKLLAVPLFLAVASNFFWSLLATSFVRPVVDTLLEDGSIRDCSWCRQAFGSVAHSQLTLVATSWSSSTWESLVLPVVHENFVCLAIFACSWLCFVLHLLHLLAAFVSAYSFTASWPGEASPANEVPRQGTSADSCPSAGEGGIDLNKGACEAPHSEASAHVERLLTGLACQGRLSLFQLLTAFDTNPLLFRGFDVTRHRLTDIFDALDKEKSGQVSCEDVVDAMRPMTCLWSWELLLSLRDVAKSAARYVLASQDAEARVRGGGIIRGRGDVDAEAGFVLDINGERRGPTTMLISGELELLHHKVTCELEAAEHTMLRIAQNADDGLFAARERTCTVPGEGRAGFGLKGKCRMTLPGQSTQAFISYPLSTPQVYVDSDVSASSSRAKEEAILSERSLVEVQSKSRLLLSDALLLGACTPCAPRFHDGDHPIKAEVINTTGVLRPKRV